MEKLRQCWNPPVLENPPNRHYDSDIQLTRSVSKQRDCFKTGAGNQPPAGIKVLKNPVQSVKAIHCLNRLITIMTKLTFEKEQT